ncbi:MAG: hypothetical protein AAF085_15670, partial [Planctomycetota bacterium]
MDNRFNFKDIVLIVLILTVGVMVFISMWMQDRRQWEVTKETLETINEHATTINAYGRELEEYKRQQEALRAGVEKSSENVNEMALSVGELIEVLKSRPAAGPSDNNPDLADINIPDGTGPVTFDSTKFKDDPTFERVADLRDNQDFSEGDYFIDAFSTTVKNLTPYISGDLYASRIQGY